MNQGLRPKAVKVLLVDDDALIIELLRNTMQAIGVDIILTATDSKVALELFERKKPDIVFTDYIMPEFDGVELLKAIKKLDNKVPVVLFTGYFDQLLIRDLFKGDVKPEHVLQKPFLSFENIVEILRKHFPDNKFKDLQGRVGI